MTAKKISACKKFRANVVRSMRTMGFLTVRADYLCVSCYQYFAENYRLLDEDTVQIVPDVDEAGEPGQETAESEEEPEEPVDQILVKLLQSKSFSELNDGNEHLWLQVMHLIGDRLCRHPVYEDGMTVKSLYKDKNFLTKLDILKFIQERNQYLVQFLCGLSGLKCNEISNQLRSHLLPELKCATTCAT